MELGDFSTSQYTAIISDLHLCEAEPVHPKFPLWKKFKTQEFFFDDTFEQFLKHIKDSAQGKTVELILNGDIFDFDSVTSIPEAPVFRVSWLEKQRGLIPGPQRSRFKIEVILAHHPKFIDSLRRFIKEGHRVVFVIGNHDLELHFLEVQDAILQALYLSDVEKMRVRFCEWFYISNKDTLIEHGNQYDPYCMCEDPVHPMIRGYNYITMKLPFGNLACRYILNGMGFFNPHVDSNYIMSLGEYLRFFVKYIARAQPLLVWTWFSGAVVTLVKSFSDHVAVTLKSPLNAEEKVKRIAYKANTEPQVVRELTEIFSEPAASNPLLLLRELWLDRALIIMFSFVLIFLGMTFIKQIFQVSFFWAFIPLFLLLPFFLFYSKSVVSLVSSYKEPNEKNLRLSGVIAGVSRIVYGHTHHARHEMIGPIEHLNSGCWSPAFLDIECTRPIDQKTFVWISPTEDGTRKAELFKFENGKGEHLSINSRAVK